MPNGLSPERVALIRRIAASASPTTVLLDALHNEEVLTHSLREKLLDRVPDELGQLLLLQAPHLLGEHADRLSDRSPCIWLDDQWDDDRSLVALPAHHIVICEGLDRDTSLEEGVRIGHSERWPALADPDPTWQPAAPPIGSGRIGGLAEGTCPACGWRLHVERAVLHARRRPAHAAAARQHVPRRRHAGARSGARPPRHLPPHPAALARAEWSQTQNINRLGGVGSWVQDAIYPSCPTCTRTPSGRVAEAGLRHPTSARRRGIRRRCPSICCGRRKQLIDAVPTAVVPGAVVAE